MINDITQEADTRMRKSVESLKQELTKLRTGRAHTSLLEGVKVEYYGSETPLSQVASITVTDSQTLTVTPWEKDMIKAIEKAITSANLGLNPATSGHAVRVPLPPLTEERRKDLARVVRQEGENARVAVRNIRRDANQHIKDLLKQKDITEDDERRAQDQIQKKTDQFIAEIETILSAKEADLMEV